MDSDTRLQRAIDYLEEHLGDTVSLEEAASHACLSMFYFSRWFRGQIGYTVTQYVRARRLTRAVQTMRADRDISMGQLALDVGFESQQGFTNAFKRTFGISPGAYQARPFQLALQEKIQMTETTTQHPRGPEMRTREAFKVVGMALDCDSETKLHIPELWTRFGPRVDEVPNRLTMNSYGICIPTDSPSEQFTYIAGVEVSTTQELPGDFRGVELPSCEYAVFTHEGSLDYLQQTVGYIFGTWLGKSSYTLTGSPDFELYDERFNPQQDDSEMEIWVPVRLL